MNKLIPSFSSGEVSPSLQARSDISKYTSGLSTCRNFIPKLEGGVTRRTGTRYINTSKDSTEFTSDYIRMQKFQISNQIGYELEFGDGYIRFYKDKGVILPDGTSYDIFDPTATYSVDDYVSVKDCITMGGNTQGTDTNAKKLYFLNNSDVFIDIPNSFVTDVSIEVNTSDNLDVSVINDNTRIQIKLADTTLSKNSAKLIQDAIRAEGTYIDIIVIENSEYAADRTLTPSTRYACEINKTFKCTQIVTGNANNTSEFCLYHCYTSTPPDPTYEVLNSDYWSNVSDPYEVEIPYRSSSDYDSVPNDLPNLDFTQSGDILYITHPNYLTYQLIRYDDANWSFELYDYDVPPFQISNQDDTHTMTLSAVSGTGVTLTSSQGYFQSGHVGSYFKIYHDIDGQSVKQVFAATGASSSIKCKGTWRIRSFGTTCDLDVDVEKSLDHGTTWEVVRSFTMENTEIDTFGEIEDYALIRLNCTSFTTGNTITLTTDPFSHAGIIKITSVTSSTVAVGDVVQTFADTIATDDWAESAWSELRGYPSTSCFYQDRLCFASTVTEPQTIWMSKTGDYYSFDVSDDVLDDDSISIQLASRKMNNITNLVPLTDIVVLTTGDEWRVGAPDSGAVTPTNIAANVQGNRGSADITPVMIGNKIVYPQPSSGIIRDLGYDYNSNSFTGENISVLSAHLFRDHTIVSMGYEQEPNSTVYLVRDDGKMITLTYLKEQDIIGYAVHDTNGTFEDVSVIVNDNEWEVWCVVKRGVKRFIEVFEEVKTDVEDQWYLDSALNYDSTPETTFSGLDHLEGYEVDVLADGNVVSGLTVTGGEITLDVAASKVIAGLGFTSEFESLPIMFEFQSGTSKDKKMRVPEITYIFENSRGGFVGDPSIGTTQEYLEESLQQRTTMDSPIELFTGQIEFQVRADWGVDPKTFYTQDEPLPVTILAIIPRVRIGG